MQFSVTKAALLDELTTMQGVIERKTSIFAVAGAPQDYIQLDLSSSSACWVRGGFR
jgi:hypothetical protein